MHPGFAQGLIVLYVLFIVVGPKRIVRWIRRLQGLVARLRRKPQPDPNTSGVLHLFEVFGQSSLVGWGLVVVGLGIVLAAYFAADLGIALQFVPVFYVAAIALLVFATLLI